MGLYQEWTAVCEAAQNDQATLRRFWNDYFDAETENYKKILSDISVEYRGTVAEVAAQFDMEPMVFSGFIDGINTSLKEAISLEDLKAEDEIFLDIDFEKLYMNMHEAKADWLYNLEEWELVLPAERRVELTREWRKSKQAVSAKVVGRNDPCPCGSGKKYKKCCGKNA